MFWINHNVWWSTSNGSLTTRQNKQSTTKKHITFNVYLKHFHTTSSNFLRVEVWTKIMSVIHRCNSDSGASIPHFHGKHGVQNSSVSVATAPKGNTKLNQRNCHPAALKHQSLVVGRNWGQIRKTGQPKHSRRGEFQKSIAFGKYHRLENTRRGWMRYIG